MVSITNMLFEHVEVEKNKTKIGKKVYEWLQYDYIKSIVLSDSTFWIECNDMPSYARNYIIKFYKRKGYKYLYDK